MLQIALTILIYLILVIPAGVYVYSYCRRKTYLCRSGIQPGWTALFIKSAASIPKME